VATYKTGNESAYRFTFDNGTGVTGVVDSETRWTFREEMEMVETPYLLGNSNAAWMVANIGWRRYRGVVEFLVDTAAANGFWNGGDVRPGETVSVTAPLSATDYYKGDMYIEASEFVAEPHGIIRGTMWLRSTGTALTVE
jgi:hypothetical protein